MGDSESLQPVLAPDAAVSLLRLPAIHQTSLQGLYGNLLLVRHDLWSLLRGVTCEREGWSTGSTCGPSLASQQEAPASCRDE